MNKLNSEHASKKQALRARMRALRNALPSDLRAKESADVCNCIVDSAEFMRADIVFVYAAFGSEVDIKPLNYSALKAGKMLAYPRCGRDAKNEPSLEWFAVNNNADLDNLHPGAYGIMEPDACVLPRIDLGAINASQALVIVPGLAFDTAGARLGYGAGYYDRFLSKFKAFSMGASYKETILSDLHGEGAVEPHDVCVHAVAVPDRVIRAGR